MEIVDKDKLDVKNKVQKPEKYDFLKEDLERYYIDEKKSLLEISEIYGCCSETVKNRLRKYNIPVRPHGTLLVAEDGETLKSKYNKGEISNDDYRDNLAEMAGFENQKDNLNDLAKKKGFRNHNEYQRKIRYKKDNSLPMSENKDCTAYLGVYICENKEFLSKIINIIESMPNNNPGYDAVCVKDKKIDVKCACLSYNREWVFNIKKNKVADYFLCISFDNRENLNVQHIWLVKGDVIIEKTNTYLSEEFIFNEKEAVHIGKGNRALKRWKKHEITDSYKLEKAQKLCDDFKNNNIIN